MPASNAGSIAVTREGFLDSVSRHTMTVLRNEGLYRHLRFSDGTFYMRFEICTIPGSLFYVGDMGAFSFQRLEDMFVFFRSRFEHEWIDFGYLAQKCVAVDKDGIRQTVDEQTFLMIALALISELREQDETSRSADDPVVAYVTHQLSLCDTHDERMTLCTDLRFNGSLVFPNFYEYVPRFSRYTGHFLWACYAIAWAVLQFDAATSGEQTAGVS